MDINIIANIKWWYWLCDWYCCHSLLLNQKRDDAVSIGNNNGETHGYLHCLLEASKMLTNILANRRKKTWIVIWKKNLISQYLNRKLNSLNSTWDETWNVAYDNTKHNLDQNLWQKHYLEYDWNCHLEPGTIPQNKLDKSIRPVTTCDVRNVYQCCYL